METINIILPNQLFEESVLLDSEYSHYLIEEYLFFKQYNFHKQKIYFHRCSMKNYFDYLESKQLKTFYINSFEKTSDIRSFIDSINTEKIKKIVCLNPEDNYLERRIKESCKKKSLKFEFYDNPAFINSREKLKGFFRTEKKKLFQTSFYKSERIRLKILLDENQNPLGGKWTYDDMNREKYPKNKQTPKVNFAKKTSNHEEASSYVLKYYKNNNGQINKEIIYPTNFATAKKWIQEF